MGGLLIRPSIGRFLSRRYGGLIPSRGGMFEVGTRARVSYQECARLFFGFYEKSERNFVQRFLRSDLDVIELGSGVGVISCAILDRIQLDRSLICVEGNPVAVDSLRRNLIRNHADRRVAIVNKAIDYSGLGIVEFRTDENFLGSSAGPGGAARVPTTTLAAVHCGSGFGKFALVSDVEGAEVGFLLEDCATISLCEQMIIELHASEFRSHRYSVADVDRLAERAGFRRTAARHNVRVYTRHHQDGA